MGLAWQQGPFGHSPAGVFVHPGPLPHHVLYAEPAGRRMRVELAGAVVATSDEVTILHETGRYPVAYFPLRDVDADLLRTAGQSTDHPELGATLWWSLEIGGRTFERVAWSHANLPRHARVLNEKLAFVWDAMDAFYEEDEHVFGHAADPYHRVDVRSSHRRLVARVGDAVVADTNRPLVVFETGFAPRWYVPRDAIRRGTLEEDPLRTFCPYKGVARYWNVVADGRRVPAGAWSYPQALPESARMTGYISFNVELVSVELDGEPLLPAEGQEVVADGTDRDLRPVMAS